jgi:NAD(P)-dependent dehydrogenase (short-subunit alcohol dehydrogenase family)
MRYSTALVTGATSGLGYAAARLLADEGWQEVIVTGRSLAATKESAAQLAGETKKRLFTPLELDLNKSASVNSALAELVKRGRPIDFLLLNAGLVPTKKRVITAEGVEASQAPLIGHHELTVGLLNANLLSPNTAYADAKLMIAWWAGALARRLPSGVAVYAVSPGASNATNVARNAGPLLKYLMIPIVNLIPGMNQTPEVAASRYIQASEFGTDVSGQFFASAKGKFSGPMELQREPHLHVRASQEAAWQAVVKVSGADLSNSASRSAVS